MTTPRARILIADDDPDIRAILVSLLEPHAAELFEARNGDEALETILVERPDLVVLDVMMPVLSGWEILKYMRERDDLAGTRVLMLTAIGHRVNELTSPLFGADAFLDKPFDLDELEAKVLELLRSTGTDA